MSYVNNLNSGDKMYIIPRGSQNTEGVISIVSGRGLVRLEVFFPQDKYQIITDQTLRERDCTLEDYIKQTESWRK